MKLAPHLSPRDRTTRRQLLQTLAALPAGLALGSRLWQPPQPAVAAEKERPKSRRPNVILITIDSLSADHIGAYGYAKGRTPNLDQLAREGVLVSAAYTVMPSTNPAHVALLTGTYPGRNGVFVHLVDKLDWELPTLAEVFQAAGYRTAGIFSWHSLEDAFSGLGRGFDVYQGVAVDVELYEEQQEEPTIAPEQRLARLVYDTSELDEELAVSEHIEDLIDGKADITTDAALRWLDRQGQLDQPFFLWLHYFDPHYPYTPPPPLNALNDDCDDCLDGSQMTIRRIIAEWHPSFSLQQTAHLRALYDREIAFTDAQLGRLLTGLRERKLEANTALVVTADHGESFGEHDLWLHGGGLYRNELRVPLLLRHPGVLPAGRVVGGPARFVDLMPTILDLANLPIPASVQGTSLLPLFSGAEADGERRAFGVAGDQSVCIATREWHLIYRPVEEEIELYRMGTDPGEVENLAPPTPDPRPSQEPEDGALPDPDVPLASLWKSLVRESDDGPAGPAAARDVLPASPGPRASRPDGDGDPLRALDPFAYQGVVNTLMAELRAWQISNGRPMLPDDEDEA